MEEIEEYLENLEDLLLSATPDLPNVREAVHRFWLDVSRFGPQSLHSLPDIHVPGLGAFEVPPPPPPPPPKSWLENSADWVSLHPWTVVAGVAGASLLVGYSSVHRHARFKRVKAASSTTPERKQVIVVLGGDHPLALPLIVDLEKKGYIVIASVSTLEAVETIEHRCNGYVRVLVLNPDEPETTPIFLRSLTSTLSRKFPVNVPGDPHASPSSHLYIHSVISLLTLPTASAPLHPTPLEHLPIQSTYLSYLLATHITPIRVVQALLPLLRTSPPRARDSVSNNHGSKSIVVCVPATDARVGLPFSSAQAMSAAATLRGFEVLRREINAAALTDTSGSMKNIKVVVVDVGFVGSSVPKSLLPQDVYKAMEEWTPSEKVAYGPAFSSILEEGRQFGVPRKPADVSIFVNSLVEVVSGGSKGGGWAFTLRLGLGRVRNWIRGERFAIGAGAHTYTYASYLPSKTLNFLLGIPHFLVSIRNSLLPRPPTVAQPSPPPPTQPPLAPPAAEVDKAVEELSEHDASASETSSEVDVESNSSGHEGVESSWIKA
ncbi:hypothetical protein PILCRDRAFT_823146 [Piloderma croceum F 1598]|uniref:DUF1776-domain-containing protein n=1 Tax=Piloderma croceum (strain F 1598) TaxID=765440 RepID=A0A0C3B054_PILCF|nr:hypothetical protein PILCRDRAFT_823146 [Piloderma croceum F 1598]